VAPADPISTIERVARGGRAPGLGVLLKANQAHRATPETACDPHPSWIGPSIWRTPAGAAAAGSDAALFPICLDGADPRCNA
jgi:hypothetical protein